MPVRSFPSFKELWSNRRTYEHNLKTRLLKVFPPMTPLGLRRQGTFNHSYLVVVTSQTLNSAIQPDLEGNWGKKKKKMMGTWEQAGWETLFWVTDQRECWVRCMQVKGIRPVQSLGNSHLHGGSAAPEMKEILGFDESHTVFYFSWGPWVAQSHPLHGSNKAEWIATATILLSLTFGYWSLRAS